jgi:hypothetical protein
MGKKHGVTYKCGEEVTSEMIKAENPDAVSHWRMSYHSKN